MAKDFDFIALRKKLSLLEDDAHTQNPGHGDLNVYKLPSQTLDWTPWVYPNRRKFVGGGGFGDAFEGEWENVPSYLGQMPRIVVKVMKLGPLPQEANNKRFKVRHPLFVVLN